MKVLLASFEPRRDRTPAGWRFVRKPTRHASSRQFESQPTETRGRYEHTLNARPDPPSGRSVRGSRVGAVRAFAAAKHRWQSRRHQSSGSPGTLRSPTTSAVLAPPRRVGLRRLGLGSVRRPPDGELVERYRKLHESFSDLDIDVLDRTEMLGTLAVVLRQRGRMWAHCGRRWAPSARPDGPAHVLWTDRRQTTPLNQLLVSSE